MLNPVSSISGCRLHDGVPRRTGCHFSAALSSSMSQPRHRVLSANWRHLNVKSYGFFSRSYCVMDDRHGNIPVRTAITAALTDWRVHTLSSCQLPAESRSAAHLVHGPQPHGRRRRRPRITACHRGTSSKRRSRASKSPAGRAAITLRSMLRSPEDHGRPPWPSHPRAVRRSVATALKAPPPGPSAQNVLKLSGEQMVSGQNYDFEPRRRTGLQRELMRLR